MKSYTEKELLELRNRYEDWIMAQPGVRGTDIGLNPMGQIVLRIYTKGIISLVQQAIEKKLADVPIEWQEGDITLSSDSS